MYTWNRKKATPITFYRECNEISITPSVTWIESDQPGLMLHSIEIYTQVRSSDQRNEKVVASRETYGRRMESNGVIEVSKKNPYFENTLNEKLTTDKRRMIVNRRRN